MRLPAKDLSDLHVADPEGFVTAVTRAQVAAEDLFARRVGSASSDPPRRSRAELSV